MVSSVPVTAYTEDESAILTMNNVTTLSGSASALIELVEGGNNITFTMSTEDVVTTRDYNIDVYR